jgi:hypothetical protein
MPRSDAARLNDEPTPPKESLWQKTQFADLVHIPSGVYFARFRVKDKLIRKR